MNLVFFVLIGTATAIYLRREITSKLCIVCRDNIHVQEENMEDKASKFTCGHEVNFHSNPSKDCLGDYINHGYKKCYCGADLVLPEEEPSIEAPINSDDIHICALCVEELFVDQEDNAFKQQIVNCPHQNSIHTSCLTAYLENPVGWHRDPTTTPNCPICHTQYNHLPSPIPIVNAMVAFFSSLFNH